ncbi:hypothetical protein [Xylophilus sp. GOD-11R]|uniref:hypothetical protein n=1 Tax=Xylophilus sp. GOD-11R TaxID=3089814 RepID=UPI00298C94C2|nr:hypothetical protein [Xylophilus sp. GOD-11R]WPB57761.1 hypothetical protein R9X41_03665 [Xylophilus sp. GOD-11R]
MDRPLVVFGNSEFAVWMARYFAEDAGRPPVAFTVHRRFLAAERIGAVPVRAFEDIATSLDPASHDIYVALEHGRNNLARAQVCDAATALGFSLASFVSPKAHVAASARIGPHTLVLEGATLQHGCSIGADTILRAGTFIGYDCRIGEHNYFGAQCFVDQHTRIGDFNTFGSGVRIAASRQIGDWNQIRAFQTLESDLRTPTLTHAGLRAEGRVYDRRAPRTAMPPPGPDRQG